MLRTIDRFSNWGAAGDSLQVADKMAVRHRRGPGDIFVVACGAAMIDTGLQPTNARRDRLVNYVEWFFKDAGLSEQELDLLK
jgi:hypothetical protein